MATGSGRAMATVLFTDLVGSTELRSRLGEQGAEELRRKHDRLLTEAVEAHQGRVVKGLGDGIMAIFPVASDAVAAAVAIQQAISRHNRLAAPLLEVRIGISGGEIVIEGDDCFGTPVIEAARLCGAAAGGQILASEMVRWLARSSEATFTPIGGLELKGLDEPVPAIQVEWEPLPESSVPLPPFLTDIGRIFVGRDEELTRLEQLWKEATTGQLRVVLVAGEPGVGKTRLAAELARMVHDEGAMVLAGRCDEDLGVPYQPFVEALRHFVDHSAPLPARLGRYGGELARLVPELAERVPALPPPLRSDPETERYRLFDAVGAWLTVASAEEPLLLILDDLHWAAKPTLMLLRHVVRVGGGRVLVLGSYRDTDLTHDHPLVDVLADLRRLGGVERLSLSGLDDGGVRMLVEQAAGRRLNEDGLALAHAVYQETEGNPFFVREILRHLAETGAVERGDGGWTTRLPIDELGIPEGVREVVGHRLSRLSGDTNQALRIAAVVGPEFELGIVQAAGNLSEEMLLGAVEEAARARLVTELSGTRFRFAHALVRATLYESLTAARKITFHRKVAEAIETSHKDALDDYLPALAHHWGRAAAPAADTARAVDYATRAGDRALAQLAHDEAANYYRQALGLLEVAEGPVEESQRLELLISLGEAQRRAGDPAHRQTLLQAAELAHKRGDAPALARAALANTRGLLPSVLGAVDAERVAMLEATVAVVGDRDPPTRARLLATLGLELTFTGDWRRCLALSDEALALARSLDNPETLARVLLARSFPTCVPDLLEERVANTAELVTAVESVPDPALTAEAHLLRGRATLEAGDVAEADRCYEVADRLSSGLGQPALRWRVIYCQACRAIAGGRFADAERLFLESRELGHRAGQKDAEWVFAIHMGLLRLEQGRLDDEVLALLEAARRSYAVPPFLDSVLALAVCQHERDDDARAGLDRLVSAPAPFDIYWLTTMCNWAAVAAHLGDVSHAERLEAALRPYAGQAVPFTAAPTPSVAHHLGPLATTLGRYDEAEQYFTDALAIHERIGAPHWVARTRLQWGRMLLARGHTGDLERAREFLDQALTTARELGLAKVERDAVALLQ